VENSLEKGKPYAINRRVEDKNSVQSGPISVVSHAPLANVEKTPGVELFNIGNQSYGLRGKKASST